VLSFAAFSPPEKVPKADEGMQRSTSHGFTKAGWGAAGGLLAGRTLAGAPRLAQRPEMSGFAGRAFSDYGGMANRVYIPAPSNKYVLEIVKKTVHIPRATFGAVSCGDDPAIVTAFRLLISDQYEPRVLDVLFSCLPPRMRVVCATRRRVGCGSLIEYSATNDPSYTPSPVISQEPRRRF
jgi:hypothetical protein